MSKPPLNYTTRIPVTRSAMECSELLAAAGADMVSMTYRDKKPVGLAFRLVTAGALRDFVMPVNIDGVKELLARADYPASVKTKDLSVYVTREHAARVAWRVIKDWLEAQLALIAADMATLDQVMLPYLQVESGSLYDLVQQRALAALEAS